MDQTRFFESIIMDSEDENSPAEDISDNPDDYKNLLFYKVFSNDLVQSEQNKILLIQK